MTPSPRWAAQKRFGSIIEGLLSVRNSLQTSQCQILPRKRETSVVMCWCSRSRSWVSLIVPLPTPVVSQVGSWLCQTRVCPRISWSLALANATSWSAPDQSNAPWVGATTCHFISLPGVTRENWPATMAARAGMVSDGGLVAVPIRSPVFSASSRRESGSLCWCRAPSAAADAVPAPPSATAAPAAPAARTLRRLTSI